MTSSQGPTDPAHQESVKSPQLHEGSESPQSFQPAAPTSSVNSPSIPPMTPPITASGGPAAASTASTAAAAAAAATAGPQDTIAATPSSSLAGCSTPVKPHLPKQQKSNRSIRSTPLPPNHAFNTTHPSYHRQYVLLRDKQNMNGAPSPAAISAAPGTLQQPPSLHHQPSLLQQQPASQQTGLQQQQQQQQQQGSLAGSATPQFNPAFASVTSSNFSSPAQPPVSPQLQPKRPKPKRESSKYVFSVDDDEDEVEEDLNREYMEGYNDALRQKHRLQRHGSHLAPEGSAAVGAGIATPTMAAMGGSVSDDLDDVNTIRKMPSRYSVYDDSAEIMNDAAAEQLENDTETFSQGESRRQSTILPMDLEDDIDDYAGDNASLSSNESFTLRERQDAINETHPFGIRIWKPAVYKKHRSVEQEADNDIHSTPTLSKNVGIPIKICNMIWTLTFGLVLFLICILLGAVTAFFSALTDPRTDQSLKYAKLYYNLGLYFLNPFGKVVLLSSDSNYIREDANLGSSLDEFRQWRQENAGRLFFTAPNAMNSHASESAPLTAYNGRSYDGAQNPTNPTTGTTSAVTPSTSAATMVGASNTTPTSSNSSDPTAAAENGSTDDDDDEGAFKKRLFGRGQWNIGRVVFYFLFYLILYPVTSLFAWIQWLGIFTIPMAKVLFVLDNHIRRHPLALSFEEESTYQNKDPNTKNKRILLCTYRSLGLHYYKYTVDGTNIFFINMNFLVLFTILDYFVLKEYYHISKPITEPTLIFVLCLISIIPLAYFIGQAVASISAQTSMGVGAVINAFFSTIVEVFLYGVALNEEKGKLVEGSIIGSVLGAVLLLPGTSMCSGALKRKTQRYNPASAGVSSTMLMYATLVMLTPTVLYVIFGQYEERCTSCASTPDAGEDCKRCHYLQPSIVIDRLYLDYLRPFSVVCVICLFTAYCIGLLFTLKTHAKLIWSTPVTGDKEKNEKRASAIPTPENQSMASVQGVSKKLRGQPSAASHQPPQQQFSDASLARTATRASIVNPQLQQQQQQQQQLLQMQQRQQSQAPAQEAGGHDAPNWSRKKSTTILLVATVTYAIIAEILVDVVDDVLKEYPIDPKFLGLTVFALVPNTTEFVNAISFAMHGNVALSMEIGSAYALQVCLLQIPIIVLYSCWDALKNGIYDTKKMFTLIFPRWDCLSTLMAVYMFTYIYAEGKSNYFKGSILILMYVVIICGFYVAIAIDDKFEAATGESVAVATAHVLQFTEQKWAFTG